jgi:phage terminase large subunit-like protein
LIATAAAAAPDDFPQIWIPEPSIAKVTPEEILALGEVKGQAVQALLNEWERTLQINPLYGVYARNIHQHEFMRAEAYINAMFGGNRSGKTSATIIKMIVNLVPLAWVPPHLMQYRMYLNDDPFYARCCVPSLQEHAIGVMLPLLRKWVPEACLRGKSWDRAWSNKYMVLHFENGSFLEFRSYDQDLSAHQGSSRHLIAFDEQPTKPIYEESLLRLAEYTGARCMFALTPLGLSWIYKDIYKRRNEPGANILIHHSSIHENDTLSKENIKLALAGVTNAAQREAREYGRFVSMAGRIYDNFSSADAPDGQVVDPIRPSQLQGDIYIGIDPGIRSPACVFAQANNLKEQLTVFDEVCPYSESTMNIQKFAEMILARVKEWGIKDPIYVIDPAAKIRDQRVGEDLLTEYARHGISAVPGNNAMELGIERVYNLIENNQLAVTRNCTQVQDEFEVWSWDERKEDAMGRARPQDGNDHTLDCIKYISLMLPWLPTPVETKPTAAPGTLEHEINRRNQPPPDMDFGNWC